MPVSRRRRPISAEKARVPRVAATVLRNMPRHGPDIRQIAAEYTKMIHAVRRGKYSLSIQGTERGLDRVGAAKTGRAYCGSPRMRAKRTGMVPPPTAAAVPDEDPPGVRVRSCGLRVRDGSPPQR